MAQFTNQAQLSYNNSVTNSNIAVGEIQEVLSATKTAISADYAPNGRIAYAISIINSGAAPFTGITVTDNLGTYDTTAPVTPTTLVPLTYVDDTVKYFVEGVLQNTPTVTATDTSLVVSNLSIPANSEAMLLYETDINQFAPLTDGSTITNTAVISGGGLTPVTAIETTAVRTEPNLSITKSISPIPVVENGTLTYTFVIQNTGNRAVIATDNASVTDLFNPILTGLNVTFNGAPWTAGTQYTYSETTGLFVSDEGQITVPAATYSQDPATGAWTVTPGVSTLVISGIV